MHLAWRMILPENRFQLALKRGVHIKMMRDQMPGTDIHPVFG
jgi:hypothetical protein